MTREHVLCTSLLLCSLAWLAVGVQGAFVPDRLLGEVSISLEGVDAHNEARALYGGMHLALGALYAVGAFRPRMRRPLLALWLILLGGLLCGRLLSVGLDGAPEGFARVLFALEASGLAMGAGVWVTCVVGREEPPLTDSL
jgi:hypothetical protein